MRHQAIIPSYAKDFQWLIHCLASLRRFATGYLPPVVCVDQSDVEGAAAITAQVYPEALLVVKNERPGHGFMRAQIAMMTADLLCPEAEIIHFIGSDCIATRPYDASIYTDIEGKPIVLYTPYRTLPDLPWKAGTSRLLGLDVTNEFMRRLPSVFPASIFAPMRRRIEEVHKHSFEDQIHANNIAFHDTSEANLLGAYAYEFMRDTCRFVSTVGYNPDDWPTAIGQHWSHGGLDRPMDGSYDYEFRGVKKNSAGKTPRVVINEILYDLPEP